jgi:hypothetical protein
MYIYIHIYIYMYIHVYIHIYIYMYIYCSEEGEDSNVITHQLGSTESKGNLYMRQHTNICIDLLQL